MARTRARKNRGSRSRRHRGGQFGSTMPSYAAAPATASGVVGSVESGLSSVGDTVGSALGGLWKKTKEVVGLNGTGGRRKRRGGSTVTGNAPMYGANAATVGGRRRKRRGGQKVSGFDGAWTQNGSAKGGSRRRRRY